MLDDLTKTDNIYLEDETGNKYFGLTYEHLQEELTIGIGDSKSIAIKFAKEYIPQVNDVIITFSNVVLDNGSIFEIKINI